MPTCEMLNFANVCHVRRQLTTAAGLFGRDTMNMHIRCLAACLALAGVAATPAWAVSRSAMGPSQPLPDAGAAPASLAAVEPALEAFSPGSAALVPLSAAEVPAIPVSTLEASTPGGTAAGKPIDDFHFVARASEPRERRGPGER